ncbi:rhomboid family intramembrane serine protease [Metabacillus iocasae]|uniref:Rhomboid protease GluP n=1 Tax=Priestia iocasae TaxID=2291674 RepID=A0ABS2QQ04_9BACI|nr:rhomboid family intramembrane serine protease [Metabacillus iocasae]MBM7701533.1 rhomboid protease GluP [Metabacillus iocasae]
MKQDLRYWKIIEGLLSNEAYHLLYASEDLSQIWFETNKNRKTTLFRIVRKDFTWSNLLEKDIDYVHKRAVSLRKQWLKKELFIQNVYIVDDYPLNDWEAVAGSYEKKDKILIDTILLTEQEDEGSYEQFARNMNVAYYAQQMEDYESYLYSEKVKQAVIQSIREEKSKEKELFNRGKPFFAYVFLAVQVAMFFFLELKGGSENNLTLLEYGAKYNPYIIQGEWWRFFTPIVLHIGFLHLLMNSFALYYLGPLVERVYGNFRFLLIYLFAGFAGTLGSFVFSSSLSAGASGAIFGCFGALLFIGRAYPKLFLRTMGYNIIMVIVINLVFGFVVPGIDNAGHIGGLIGGFLAASIVHLPTHKRIRTQFISFLTTIALTVALLIYGFNEQNVEKDTDSALMIASQYIQKEEYSKVNRVLTPFIDGNSKDSRVYFLASIVEFQENDLNQARQYLESAVQYNNQFHEAHYNLALIYSEMNETEKAKEAVNKAVQLDSSNEKYNQLWGKLHNKPS